MVEFSLYASIDRQYMAKIPDEDSAVITDPAKVTSTLNSLCVEMDNRYELLKGGRRSRNRDVQRALPQPRAQPRTRAPIPAFT